MKRTVLYYVFTFIVWKTFLAVYGSDLEVIDEDDCWLEYAECKENVAVETAIYEQKKAKIERQISLKKYERYYGTKIWNEYKDINVKMFNLLEAQACKGSKSCNKTMGSGKLGSFCLDKKQIVLRFQEKTLELYTRYEKDKITDDEFELEMRKLFQRRWKIQHAQLARVLESQLCEEQ